MTEVMHAACEVICGEIKDLIRQEATIVYF